MVFFSADGTVGVAAAVCWDGNGVYLDSSALVINGLTNPTSLEAIAIREGQALAEDLGLQWITIKTDCKTLVADLREDQGGTHGAIIREITSRKRSFRSCYFMFKGRATNGDAHN